METLNFSWLIDGQVAGHRGPSSDNDLDYLKSKGIRALVRMAQGDQLKVTPAQIQRAGLMDCYEPVPDFDPPEQAQMDRIVAFIKESLDDGRAVGVSCFVGIGRTGTVLACYLVSKGYTAEQAMAEVKHKRGAEIECKCQKEAVRSYGERLGKE